MGVSCVLAPKKIIASREIVRHEGVPVRVNVTKTFFPLPGVHFLQEDLPQNKYQLAIDILRSYRFLS